MKNKSQISASSVCVLPVYTQEIPHLLPWHIKIQLYHRQWHNKLATYNSNKQPFHPTVIPNLTALTNWHEKTLRKMTENSSTSNDQKYCQLSRMSTAGPTTEVRGHPTGVRLQVWQKTTTKDPLPWIAHQRGHQPQAFNCWPICFTSQFDNHQMPHGPNRGYTKHSDYTLSSKQHDRCYIHQKARWGCCQQSVAPLSLFIGIHT